MPICDLPVDIRIAAAVYLDEMRAARQLGASHFDSSVSGLEALDGVLSISAAPDKPAVWPRGSEPR